MHQIHNKILTWPKRGEHYICICIYKYIYTYIYYIYIYMYILHIYIYIYIYEMKKKFKVGNNEIEKPEKHKFHQRKSPISIND